MSFVSEFGRKLFQIIVVLSAYQFAAGFALAAAEEQGAPASAETPYTVVCEGEKPVCRVDRGTYKGWRTYHAVCHVCHAQDAVGSTFAPNLVDRLKGMDKERFMDVLLNGFTGEIGVMPGWKEDPNVLPRVDDLWAYLKARSDGALGLGKPKKLPKKN